MAIPGLTYRLEKGTSLTHQEMDDNFRSLFYSSSLHSNGDVLRLHFDTSAGDYYEIPLNSSTGSLALGSNVDNQVLTATGTIGLVQGEPNLLFSGSLLTVNGKIYQDDGNKNIFLGNLAGDTSTGASENVAIGYNAAANVTGNYNTGVGVLAIKNITNSCYNTAFGHQALNPLTAGNCNTSIGAGTAGNLTSGTGNVHLGFEAGPGSSVAESNKLYINNSASNTPLILGDFSTGQVTINSQVSASIFSGSFVGDGSGLTGLTVTQGWDGTHDGNVEITGSMVVSGSNVTVDFTNVNAISGSIFSGSFVGDGSGLTGVQATTFPYTGSAQITGSLGITGSLEVSGSNPAINLKGITTVQDFIKIHVANSGNTPTNVGIGFDTYKNLGSTSLDRCNTAIGYCAGAGNNTYGSGETFSNITIGAFAQQTGLSRNTIAIGTRAACQTSGESNIAIGNSAMSTASGSQAISNTVIGDSSLFQGCKTIANTALGTQTLYTLKHGNFNTAIGFDSLRCLTNTVTGLGVLTNPSNENTALGYRAGYFSRCSTGNLYLGSYAGPLTPTNESNKLYISNIAGNPLIGGDFIAKTVTISGSILVSQSIAAHSYFGDGSNLTGVEWDGTYNGNAQITGSLTVSGSSVVVDFTNTTAISGSTFSGSFVGDGSQLTGVVSEWDGTRNGNAQITGSLIVSGALDISDTVTIASTGYPGGQGVELIHIHSSSLAGNYNLYSFSINTTTGYTGIKADYTLTNSSESEKKVGTLYGGWDQVGNSTITDSHTAATGGIVSTSFSIDASDTNNAILKLDASSGTYELNMLVTAFKRQV